MADDSTTTETVVTPAATATTTAPETGATAGPTRLPEDHPLVKAYAATRDELKNLRDAEKTDLQRANERVTEAETELAALPAKAAETLKSALVTLGVVAKEDEVLLTASDPDALLAQVSRLSERAGSKKTHVVPKEGANNTAVEGDDRATVRAIFGGD